MFIGFLMCALIKATIKNRYDVSRYQLMIYALVSKT